MVYYFHLRALIKLIGYNIFTQNHIFYTQSLLELRDLTKWSYFDFFMFFSQSVSSMKAITFTIKSSDKKKICHTIKIWLLKFFLEMRKHLFSVCPCLFYSHNKTIPNTGVRFTCLWRNSNCPYRCNFPLFEQIRKIDMFNLFKCR